MVKVPRWYTVHLLCHGWWKHFSTLLAPVFGHWCDKAVRGCVTSLGYSRGESPWWCCVCVRLCVCPQKGKNATIERHAIAPAILSPAPPPSPVLTCTLTYSWSRFGDTQIKAFLCFSLSLLSSFSSVTRALSAAALAVHIESSFTLTQPLFTLVLW